VDVTELLFIAVMAAGWWIPTFVALAELQRRDDVRRPLVWKWSALQALPVAGYLWYFRRGRAELDADASGRGRSGRNGRPGGGGRRDR
jgi:hypothetical protein